jgi:hypothetical protein
MKKIPLTQGKFAIVDDEDFEALLQFKWHVNRHRSTWYAVRWIGSQKIHMHRVITNAPLGMDVDHIDGDGLNNQRSNLRVCSKQENHWNQGLNRNSTSGFKGVVWHKWARKWQAHIRVNGKRLYLGLFNDKTAAARAYNEAATKHFGNFARLNNV